MEILKVQVLTYNELDEPAKERARKEMLADGYPFGDWWTDDFEVIKQAGRLLGFEIEHISFSLYPPWVAFGGSYRQVDNPDTVKVEFPNAHLLHCAADHLKKIARKYPGLAAILEERHGRQYVSWYIEDEEGEEDVYDSGLEKPLALLQNWAHSLIKMTYANLTSNDRLREFAEMNEVLFYPSGKVVEFPGEAIVNE